MDKRQQAIKLAYSEAKRGAWEPLLSAWRQDPQLAKLCSRYRKPSSGWTFLHQAAYFGHEAACRELIRLGAAAAALSDEQQRPTDVAEEHNHFLLAAFLARACESEDISRRSLSNPDLLPSSSLWNEALERQASELMCVAYGDYIVKIPAGSRYYVDSFERTLVGWHGTFDPPSGMSGESMV
ncbi:hypothetical protein KBY97_06290 [Synechococcus sp. ATX 2A4]|uniref:hypothetical protein n=1 Tax=Synechococcus sp. ATX 2A4 TaxID=2823727 RepID=UPI0020CB9F1A|nr:hypothetical protein [Synechococcus sp. ATX 2A4]MCP9884734.1 hypothetical protein [Synechococcus sp. ATX 2A4]